MNRSIEPRRLALLALLAAGLSTGCALKPRTAKKPVVEPEAVEETAPEPSAAKGDARERYAKALQLMKERKTKEAGEAFLALAKDFPTYSGPLTNLGILYAKSNRRGEAVEAFNRALVAKPDNVVAANWMGIVHREAGDYVKAQQAYEKAIQIKPDFAAAHLNLGLLMEEHLKRPAEALPHYRRYQELVGDKDLRVLVWIAEIEARQPKPAEPATASKEGGKS